MNKEVDCLIEIPLNTDIKYEFDKELNMLRCDRFLHTSMGYPGNYGYIPKTLSDDGDPIDLLLVSSYSLIPGCIIKVKIIGVLEMRDEKGYDEKLIAVPSNKIDPESSKYNDIEDVSETLLNKIKHFFKHYKDNEKNKFSEVLGFKNKEVALKYLEDAIKRYEN